MGEGWLQEELCSGLTGGSRETGLWAKVGREARGEKRGKTDVKEGGVEKVGGDDSFLAEQQRALTQHPAWWPEVSGGFSGN